jgi:hypothetical protein
MSGVGKGAFDRVEGEGEVGHTRVREVVMRVRDGVGC